MWMAYFQEEKEIYAELLKNPDEVVKGTVKELAEKYDGFVTFHGADGWFTADVMVYLEEET